MNYNRYKVTQIITTNDEPVDLGELAPLAKTFGDYTAKPDSEYYVQGGGDDIQIMLEDLPLPNHADNAKLLEEQKEGFLQDEEVFVGPDEAACLLVHACDNNVHAVLETLHSIGTRPSIDSYASYVSITSYAYNAIVCTQELKYTLHSLYNGATWQNAEAIATTLSDDSSILMGLIDGIEDTVLKNKVKRKVAAALLNSIDE